MMQDVISYQKGNSLDNIKDKVSFVNLIELFSRLLVVLSGLSFTLSSFPFRPGDCRKTKADVGKWTHDYSYTSLWYDVISAV